MMLWGTVSPDEGPYLSMRPETILVLYHVQSSREG